MAADAARVTVFFPNSGETRLYATASAPLRRVQFKPGDTLTDMRNQTLMVESVKEEKGLFWYTGRGRTLSEAELGRVEVSYGADENLLADLTTEPHLMDLRLRAMHHEHLRRTSPLSGFLGGRIDLIPHQLYIAHEVCSRFAPRVLLSDEVGLGKTIEAGLIVHRLLRTGRITRVLVLVPDSLVHQWFVELLRRFNLWFHIFDEDRSASLDESAPDGNPFLDNQLILCSTSFLAESPARAQQALAAAWDLLVVDEAHHLAWSPEAVSTEYAVAEALSQATPGLLLLTATPEQLGLESHFARLRLLDPQRYADFAAFAAEQADQQAIATLARALESDQALSLAETVELERLFGHDRMRNLDQPAGRQRLLTELIDQYGPGRVIFRNTRTAMAGFPIRRVNLTSLPGDEAVLARWKAEFEADQRKTGGGWKPDFEKDPRLDWLAGILKSAAPAKVLLICHSKEKVLALDHALSRRVNVKTGVFHEDLTIVQRDRNAAWFADPHGARLLICSEIGSEGRNFQFAHHLVLFDLPLHPELLVQRMGRLDRIGQTSDMTVHVPLLQGSAQEALAVWYHKALNAFEANLEGGDAIWRAFGSRLLTLAGQLPESRPELDHLLAETTAFNAALQERLKQGRNRLLELNSFRKDVADQLVNAIHAEDQDPQLEAFMSRAWEVFALDVEDLAPRTYLLHAHGTHAGSFPSLPKEGLAVTFDRKRALHREDVQFITWDHPLVTETLDLILGTGTGNALLVFRRGESGPFLLLESYFILETAGKQHLHVDRFLPFTPLRVVTDFLADDVTDHWPPEALEGKAVPDELDRLYEEKDFTPEQLREMVGAAIRAARRLAEREKARAYTRMEETLNAEIERLRALQVKNNHVRAGEIEAAERERDLLAAQIDGAEVRLDAVRLVWRR